MRTLLAAVLLLGFAACSDRGGGPGSGSAAGLEGEMKGWRDRMCACPDKICTERTMLDYASWKRTKLDVARAMPKSERAGLGALERELKACRKEAHGAEPAHAPGGTPPAMPPATPPAAPPPATPPAQTDK